MFILSRPNDAEEDFTSFRKLNSRILCPPSVKILVSVFPLSFLPSALAMIGIRCAAWLSKAAEEARPLWGSFMAAAFAIQSGSSGEHIFRACGAIFGTRRVFVLPVSQKIYTVRLKCSGNYLFLQSLRM